MTTLSAENDGKIIHYTGQLTTDDPVSDPLFHTLPKQTSTPTSISSSTNSDPATPSAPPAYEDAMNDNEDKKQLDDLQGPQGSKEGLLKVSRTVEYYQWSERKEETKDSTRYTYNRAWRGSAIDSSQFQLQSEHDNPPVELTSDRFRTSSAQVGPFQVDASLLAQVNNRALPTEPRAEQTDSSSRTRYNGGRDGMRGDPRMLGRRVVKRGGWTYLVQQSVSDPVPGDMRVRHTGIQPLTVSVLGRQHGGRWIAAVKQRGPWIQEGHQSAQTIVKSAQGTQSMLVWAIRVGGLLLNVYGTQLLIAPIAQLASFLPAGLSSVVGLITGGTLVAPLSAALGGLTMAGGYVHARSKNTLLKHSIVLGYLLSLLMSFYGIGKLNKFLLIAAARAAKSVATGTAGTLGGITGAGAGAFAGAATAVASTLTGRGSSGNQSQRAGNNRNNPNHHSQARNRYVPPAFPSVDRKLNNDGFYPQPPPQSRAVRVSNDPRACVQEDYNTYETYDRAPAQPPRRSRDPAPHTPRRSRSNYGNLARSSRDSRFYAEAGQRRGHSRTRRR